MHAYFGTVISYYWFKISQKSNGEDLNIGRYVAVFRILQSCYTGATKKFPFVCGFPLCITFYAICCPLDHDHHMTATAAFKCSSAENNF